VRLERRGNAERDNDDGGDTSLLGNGSSRALRIHPVAAGSAYDPAATDSTELSQVKSSPFFFSPTTTHWGFFLAQDEREKFQTIEVNKSEANSDVMTAP
jgi:hypothetical protein